MDSWGFASDESLSTGKVKAPFSFGNNTGLFPNEVNIEHQVFEEMGLRNSLFHPGMAAPQNAFSEENKSSSKLESNCTESGLFNLNLCKVIDQREAQILNSSKIAHSLSLSKVSTPSKGPRIGGFSSSTPFCQVHGCNKNLSSSKDYHKRHKVCEVHSKTAKVIVNGIEQRFCQQCSRFHLLGEFDGGKRSCRKRLAGHNERRRKPHVGVVSGRYERLLPLYNISVKGNEFKRSTGAISSFPLPNAFHSRHQHKHKTNQCSQMNLEDQPPHNLQSISSITVEQLHSLSMASSSESALSLLSYQSQNTASNSSRIHISNLHSRPLLYDMSPALDSEGSLVSYGVDGMFQGSKHMNSEGSLVNFGIDGMFRGSKASKHMNSNWVFSDEGQTIDLIQLSSQLERVEHKKQTNGVYVT